MPRKTISLITIETIVLCGIYLAIWCIKGFSDEFVGARYNEVFAYWVDCDQYAYLADALLHGRLSLDLPVAPGLVALDNPYDFMSRHVVGRTLGEPIFWDYAYFDGAYYSYFGVVPAVILYLPYELITGQFLNTAVAVAILGAAGVASSGLLIACVVHRWFPDASPLAVALAPLIMFGGSNFVYLESVPRFYSVPILTSIFFTSVGLSLWILSLGRSRPSKAAVGRTHAKRPPHAGLLFFGSLCMALNLGCRPQFMLACFLAIPLFWREIRHERTLFSRAGIGATIAALVPFVLVAAPLLAYNAARFGSPLNFGATYNLTGFDMTTYEQTPYQTLVLLFCYLLLPFIPDAGFPFLGTYDTWRPLNMLHDPVAFILMIPSLVIAACIVVTIARSVAHLLKRRRPLGICVLAVLVAGIIALGVLAMQILVADDRSALMGFAPSEPMFAGYLLLVPYSLLVLLLPRVRETLKAHNLWGTCLLMVAFAGIVLVVDTRMAGITQRYFGDFGWYLMLVACLVMFSYQQQASARKFRVLASLIIVSLVFSVVVGALSFISPYHYDPLPLP